MIKFVLAIMLHMATAMKDKSQLKDLLDYSTYQQPLLKDISRKNIKMHPCGSAFESTLTNDEKQDLIQKCIFFQGIESQALKDDVLGHFECVKPFKFRRFEFTWGVFELDGDTMTLFAPDIYENSRFEKFPLMILQNKRPHMLCNPCCVKFVNQIGASYKTAVSDVGSCVLYFTPKGNFIPKLPLETLGLSLEDLDHIRAIRFVFLIKFMFKRKLKYIQ